MGRKIRQVSDLITNENLFYFKELKNKNFLGLRVICRNSPNKEIPFLEELSDDSYDIVLNFGDISKNFDPPIKDFITRNPVLSGQTSLRHIKFEIEYILTDLELSKSSNGFSLDKIIDLLLPTKFITFAIEGNIQPEFYITLPKGWRISDGNNIEGGYVKLTAFSKDKNPKNPKENPWIEIKDELNLYPPFIKNNNGLRTYNYLIHPEDYTKITNEANLQQKILKYEFSYQSNLFIPIAGILLYMPYIFLLMSSLLLGGVVYSIINHSILKTGSILGMSYIIVLLSFTYYYASLVNDGYNIGRKDFYVPIFIFSVIIAASIVLICM